MCTKALVFEREKNRQQLYNVRKSRKHYALSYIGKIFRCINVLCNENINYYVVILYDKYVSQMNSLFQQSLSMISSLEYQTEAYSMIL